MKQRNVYLDYAAATPVDAAVKDVMLPFLQEQFYNPSALYLAAKDVKQALELARQRVAQVLGARPGEITFTAGGTEANNLAIAGIMNQHPGADLLISAVEHESVREVARTYGAQEIAVDKTGVVQLEQLKKQLSDTTVLVSIMLVNNEIGTIEPIKEIASIIQRERLRRQQTGNALPIYLHTDACQAANFLDLHVHRLGVDLMTLNAGKIYGPKQAGLLYVRAGITLRPLIHGGGQEQGLRSGTENTGACVGFTLALQEAQKQRPAETTRLGALQELFIQLLSTALPQAVVNGPIKRRVPNNVHITIPGQDNERLLMELDERGIMCATGSACSASNDEPSHVLKSIGLSDDAARSSLRFTLGRATTEADIRYTVSSLQDIVPSSS